MRKSPKLPSGLTRRERLHIITQLLNGKDTGLTSDDCSAVLSDILRIYRAAAARVGPRKGPEDLQAQELANAIFTTELKRSVLRLALEGNKPSVIADFLGLTKGQVLYQVRKICKELHLSGGARGIRKNADALKREYLGRGR